MSTVGLPPLSQGHFHIKYQIGKLWIHKFGKYINLVNTLIHWMLLKTYFP